MDFLDMFMGSLGASPAFLTLVAAILFLAYAAARRVPLAWELMAAGLAALAVVGPETITLSDTVAPRSLPLAAAGLVLGSVAAAPILVGTGRCSRPDCSWPASPAVRRKSGRAPSCCPIAVHLSIVAMLIVGAVFDDWLAGRARRLAALLVLVLGVGSAVHVSLDFGCDPGRARRLVSAARNRCVRLVRLLDPRPAVPGNRRRQSGCIAGGFWVGDLQPDFARLRSASTRSSWVWSSF